MYGKILFVGTVIYFSKITYPNRTYVCLQGNVT